MCVCVCVGNKAVKGLADKGNMKRHFLSVIPSLVLCTDYVKKQFQRHVFLPRV